MWPGMFLNSECRGFGKVPGRCTEWRAANPWDVETDPESSTWALLQRPMNSHIKWDKGKLKLASCEFRTGLDTKYSYKKVFGFMLLGV